jgi:phage baseplate assembly protein W
MATRFPYQIDGRGCSATTGGEDDVYIRDLMEQVLLTAPGERVNRPDFGSGLFAALFESADDVMTAMLQANVQSALQRWLAELVQVQAVDIDVQESAVNVTVQYVVNRTQQPQVASFSAPRALG